MQQDCLLLRICLGCQVYILIKKNGLIGLIPYCTSRQYVPYRVYPGGSRQQVAGVVRYQISGTRYSVSGIRYHVSAHRTSSSLGTLERPKGLQVSLFFLFVLVCSCLSDMLRQKEGEWYLGPSICRLQQQKKTPAHAPGRALRYNGQWLCSLACQDKKENIGIGLNWIASPSSVGTGGQTDRDREKERVMVSNSLLTNSPHYPSQQAISITGNRDM